jgi:geranylgeranyl pyrophosphate synthase
MTAINQYISLKNLDQHFTYDKVQSGENFTDFRFREMRKIASKLKGEMREITQSFETEYEVHKIFINYLKLDLSPKRVLKDLLSADVTNSEMDREDAATKLILEHINTLILGEADNKDIEQAKSGISRNKKFLLFLDILIELYEKIYSSTNNINNHLIAANLVREQLFILIYAHWNGNVRDIILKAVRFFLRSFNFYLFEKNNTEVNEIDFKAQIFKLLKKRISRPSVRASSLTWVYEYIRNCDDNFHLDNANSDLCKRIIPTIAEMVIAIQYYHNQVLDHKYGVYLDSDIQENVLAANYLKESCFEYIEMNAPSEKIMKLVLRNVQMIFMGVDIGQYVDKHHNNYNSYLSQSKDSISILNDNNKLKYEELIKALFDNIDLSAIRINQNSFYSCFTPTCKELERIVDFEGISDILFSYFDTSNNDYVKIYYNRIYLTNTILFQLFTELILEIEPCKKEAKSILFSMRNYSLILQLINDVADFIPRDTDTVGKSINDVMKDLENGTVTLPIILHLDKRPDGRIAEYLKGKESSFNHEEVLYEVLKFGALEKVRELSKKLSGSTKKLKCNNSIAGKLINDLRGISHANYYYKEMDILTKKLIPDLILPRIKIIELIIAYVKQIYCYFNSIKGKKDSNNKVIKLVDSINFCIEGIKVPVVNLIILIKRLFMTIYNKLQPSLNVKSIIETPFLFLLTACLFVIVFVFGLTLLSNFLLPEM